MSVIVLSFVFLMACTASIPKLGLINKQLTPCPNKSNCVISQITDKEHYIRPISFIGKPQDAQDRLLHILKTLDRTKIIAIQQNYIRVEFFSKIFKFVDDVEFHFPSTSTAPIIINFRSASRIGYSDFGANQKRIEQIREQFNEYHLKQL